MRDRQGAPGRHEPHARPELRARSAGIEFLDRDNVRKNPWGTSWGFSTRMVGATIMAHGDDSGLVLPPNVAPDPARRSCPIFRTEDDRVAVAAAIGPLEAALSDVQTASGPLRVKVDWREESPGFKFNHWELRGVPFRLEVGPRDVAAGQAVLVRRVDRAKEPIAARCARRGPARAPGRVPGRPCSSARSTSARRNTHRSTRYDDFRRVMEGEGGFPMAPWCGDPPARRRSTQRPAPPSGSSPSTRPTRPARASSTAEPSARRVLFARAY